MKKLFFIFFFLIIFLEFSFSFEFTMGMSLKDITELCNKKPEFIEEDRYYIFPEKSHPFFITYIAFVDSNYGLYGIRAISEYIESDNFGTEIKKAFAEILNEESEKLGTPFIIDKLPSDSFFINENERFHTLESYSASWKSTFQTRLKDNLSIVTLYVGANKFIQKGCIILEYIYTNSGKVWNANNL